MIYCALILFVFFTEFKVREFIVIRNGKMVWKHGPKRSFVLFNLGSENY